MLHITAQLSFSAKIFSPHTPPPKKSSSSEREYLRLDEVLAMIQAAKKVGRHGVIGLWTNKDVNHSKITYIPSQESF